MTITTQTQTILWPGQSGNSYKYWIHPIATEFTGNEGGNYIFAKKNAAGHWVPVYIGQTSNFSERFDNHHAMPCIKRNGATHIHAHTATAKSTRLAEESDLIAKWNTSCNNT